MTFRVMMPLRAVAVPLVARNLLRPSSKEYFDRTRAEEIRKSEEAEDGGEEAWIESLPAIKAFGPLLEKEGGPFIMGETCKFSLNL